MTTALVTGGAGFIGSHLCDYLLREGYRVICLDNFLTGRRENILHLAKIRNFDFLEHDITNPLPPNLKSVDQIYNLACPASPVQYAKFPLETVSVNTAGVTQMLDLAQKCSSRILQASTSEVYGDPTVHPQKESYRGNVNPIGVRACYDEGKRIAETLFFEYHRQFKTDIRVARIFNTYGPRMEAQDGRVVSNFVVQALSGEPLTVYGDGSDTRSFCFVSDMVLGLYKLMNTDNFTGPVNLGNPDERTVLDLSQIIISLTASRSKIAFHPAPPDSPHKRRPDITLAKKILGWEPKVSLKQGLTETIDYFKRELTTSLRALY